MVAVIHYSGSLRNILNYNEQKVKQGLATCLEAGYYPADAVDLNFHQKLRRLEKLTELNENTRVNSVHISLNFDPSETLSDELLKEIAEVYLQKIGFELQPYLLYKHLDSGHLHVHLVTTNIKATGKRIRLHNLAKFQSKKARLEIEIAYDLVKAEESPLQKCYRLKPVDAQKVIYGKSETKRAIGNVLGKVLNTYAYCSLPELNAILKLYNVVADEGSEGSRTRQYEGLVYRVLDERGNKVGTPIKASLYNWDKRPTLKFLKEKFEVNTGKKESLKARVKTAIDFALLRDKMDLQRLIEELKKEGIDVVVRKNADGVIYGLTYVDHKKAVVFNGSDLGKAYGAKGVLERCTNEVTNEEKLKNGQAEKERLRGARPVEQAGGQPGKQHRGFTAGQYAASIAGEGKNLIGFMELTDALLGTDEPVGQMDFELKRKRRKRKKQRITSD
ncbi:MAG: conjugal transfer protein MobB [Mucilaginibacter sp.]